MRRILALILVIAAVSGVFAACSDKPIVDEDGITVHQNMIYHETQEGKSRIKISFTEAGLGRNWLVEIAKEFVRENKEYLILLDGDPVLANSLSTKLESGRNLSDIFMPLNTYWETFVYQGLLEPLDDVYAAFPDGDEGSSIYQKMDEAYYDFVELETNDGLHKYILPWNDNITGIVYNQNMFDKYGWQIPVTATELMTLCDKILQDTQGNIKPFVYPGKIGGYFDFIGSTWWLQSSGVEGLNTFYNFESAEVYNATIQPALGKKQALEAFSAIFKNSKNYAITGSMSKDHTAAQMDFVNGNAAMIVNGSWMENEMRTNTPDGFKMGFMSIPYIESATKVNGEYIKYNYIAPPDFMLVPKEAENLAGAKKFLIFMHSEEMLRLFTQQTGAVRPYSYGLDSLENLSQFSQDVIDIKQSSVTYFGFTRNKLYMNGFAKKFIGGEPYSALVRGEISPTQFCNREYVEADNSWMQWVQDSI